MRTDLGKLRLKVFDVLLRTSLRLLCVLCISAVEICRAIPQRRRVRSRRLEKALVSQIGACMEREKELVKLINVLRRTSRMALQSEWTGGKEDAAAFCTDQYKPRC